LIYAILADTYSSNS